MSTNPPPDLISLSSDPLLPPSESAPPPAPYTSRLPQIKPRPKPSPKSEISRERERRVRDDEELIDRFATLFSPATPPATPRLTPILTGRSPGVSPPRRAPSQSQSYFSLQSQVQQPRQPRHRPSLSDSEFGSFVSVLPSEDPLGASEFSPIESAGFSLSGFAVANAQDAERADGESPASKATEGSDLAQTQNFASTSPIKPASAAIPPSLSFFDTFTKDAKRAAERNKHDLLDELLNHQDDPLYFVKTEQADVHPGPNLIGEGDRSGLARGRADVDVRGAPLEDNLVDLGIDVRVSEMRGSQEMQDTPKATATISDQTSHAHSTFPAHSYSYSESPLRAPLDPYLDSSPATQTSPLFSTSASTPTPAPGAPGQPALASILPAPSYNTLSKLSSNWVSAFLSGPSASSGRSKSPDNFSSVESADRPARGGKRPGSTASDAASSLSRASTMSPHPHPLAYAQTLSGPFPPSRTPTLHLPAQQISHGTPFAAHAFAPPSGAPGFAGDHAWDKGFSDDVGVVTELGVGGVVESVVLTGRRESTMGVLTGQLADLIRPHLPALARLPRTWVLRYSLDQHGISLNTLYARCEAPTPTLPATGIGLGTSGTLIVVRDSGGGVFGVWMGEEVRHSRGSYYGSGESFLWKYVGGQLRVFKWTGKNDYVALCESEYISFGGGDGHYGLYLNDTLLDGSSARCPTFENEPLCSDGVRKGGTVSFECVGLEVWSVGSS